MFMYVFVRACVRACTRSCVRACVRRCVCFSCERVLDVYFKCEDLLKTQNQPRGRRHFEEVDVALNLLYSGAQI